MTEIIESDGDIFESGCEALVNPVDAATGAQGAGLAKLFKKRYPGTCTMYRMYCHAGGATPGGIWCARACEWLLFAATKDHWKNPSRIDWIHAALDNIVDFVSEKHIVSVGIPALGCGEGRLSWDDVRPLELAAAQRMSCERVVLFRPKARAPRGRR